MSDQTEACEQVSEFEQQASTARRGMIPELIYLLMHNKKWWLLPLVFMLLMVSVLVILGGTAFAPFIYTLF
jgi:hypothetical protein